MIVAFTGAGISKESGVPTFNEVPGIRDKLSRSFARRYPAEFKEVITMLEESCKKAEPNEAHKALAKHKIPILTMNIDMLHQRAGSEVVIPLHGELPDKVVLYEDPAPNYAIAYDMVGRMRPDPEKDLLLIVGTSFYTGISNQIRMFAKAYGVKTIIINDEASKLVPITLDKYSDYIEDYEEFMKREVRF